MKQLNNVSESGTEAEEPSNLGSLNVMTIIYNINRKEKQLKLFGKNFINNNKENCYIVINGEKSELQEYIDITKLKGNKLEVKLYETKSITTMSCMFCNCSSLQSLPDISKWNTKNVIDMNSMFSDCKSLQSLPDISKWDTKNVTVMAEMFYNCSSLQSLPDISKWDTKNVTAMSYMFYNCSSLQSLPDISKWDTKQVTNMNHMFDGIFKDIIPKNFKMC